MPLDPDHPFLDPELRDAAELEKIDELLEYIDQKRDEKDEEQPYWRRDHYAG